MNLLPDGLAKKLPAYGAQENLSLDDHVMHVAYFSIISNWHWYGCEASATLEYEDGERKEVSLRDVGANLHRLWKNHKSGAFSPEGKRDDVQDLCKSSNSNASEKTGADDGRKKSGLEGRDDSKLGVCVPEKTRASNGEQDGICEKSESGMGGTHGNLPAEGDDSASQGRRQAERLYRELGVDGSIEAHESAQPRGEKPALQGRKVRLLDITFFGYVMGLENEWGDFSLFEMKECTFAGGTPAIERDLYFKPCTFAELLKRVGGSNG